MMSQTHRVFRSKKRDLSPLAKPDKIDRNDFEVKRDVYRKYTSHWVLLKQPANLKAPEVKFDISGVTFFINIVSVQSTL